MLQRIVSIISLMAIFGMTVAYSADFEKGLKPAQLNLGVTYSNDQDYTVVGLEESVSNVAAISIAMNETSQPSSSVVSESVIFDITSDFSSGASEDVILRKLAPSAGIPYGDLSALKSMKLLPSFDMSTYIRGVDTNINWSGDTGERSEIGLFPDDHAAFIAGQPGIDINLITSTADQAMPSSFSLGHIPNLYWLPYLMTGDAKYISHMEGQYVRMTAKMGVPVNEFANWYESGRYFAWSLRNLAQLAYLQKKGLTTQKYYIDALNFTKTYLTNNALNNTSEKAYDTWRVLKFNAVTYDTVGFTGWMESMMGIVVNYVVQLGFTDWLPLAEWHFVQLERRVQYWGWKGVDADHCFFYERASGLGESDQITDYNSARAWSAKIGETIQQSWERVTPYSADMMIKNTYANYPEGQLFTADTTVDGSWYTYHSRAQYAYHWAAMAARNGVAGAAEIADSLHEKLIDRGDVIDYKNNASGYPFSVALTPITNFRWTPARDVNGVVTESSWQQLPIATKENPVVYRIIGSDPVDELTTELISRGFNPASKDYGNGKVTGTFTAWVGQALDPEQKKAWIPWGGGHADSSMNGVWEFDINKLKWSVESMPSDPNAAGFEWSNSYKNSGSFTVYRDDEGGSSYELPDGRPPSQHTYGGVFKSGDYIVTTRNRRFAYNLVTKEYSVDQWLLNGLYHQPGIQNYMFTYGSSAFGVMKAENVYGGFYKVPDTSTPDIVAVSAPVYEDILWNGGHALAQLGADKIIATSYTNKYAIFDMGSESWGPSINITGDLTTYTYDDELQVLLYIPNWGAAGSMIRQFMSGSNKGKWYLLDLDTNVQTALTLTGSTIPYTPWAGQKVFIIEIGGITAMIYTSVRSGGISQTNIMRIK